MSFVIFQVVFAALAMALLAVIVLIAREVRARRAARREKASGDVEAAVPGPRPAGIGRKAAPAADPASDPAEPARPRRRQLQSFVEQERGIEPEPLPHAPVLQPEAPAELPADPEPDGDLGQTVLARLEQAFDALEAGTIALGTYRERVREEEAALEARIAALGPDASGPELEAALAARESVRWCLNWADEVEAGSGN